MFLNIPVDVRNNTRTRCLRHFLFEFFFLFVYLNVQQQLTFFSFSYIQVVQTALSLIGFGASYVYSNSVAFFLKHHLT